MAKSNALLVVGGGGFIGSHVMNHAVKKGWDVVSLTLGSRSANSKPPKNRHLSVDVGDRDSLREALKKFSFRYVVNCVGYVDHSPFMKGGRSVIDVHFQGILNLVEALQKNDLESFINIGSSDEYGTAKAPQSETLREAPIAPYSLAKTAATHFLQMLHQTEKFPATTLRLFLAYGPGQDQKRFLPQIIRGCLEGKSFPVSEGQQLRDFCYIEDVIEAIFLALVNPKAQGEVLNIASGSPISIRQVIEKVQGMIGKGTPRFGEIAYRPGENMALYADIEKVRRILGWQPKTSLDSGLEKTITHIKSEGV